MYFLYRSVSQFTRFLPRNKQGFCPSPDHFYQAQSFREYLFVETVQSMGCLSLQGRPEAGVCFP